MLLLNDAYLVATAHSVELVRSDGTRQSFPVEGLHSLFRMSSAYVEAVTNAGVGIATAIERALKGEIKIAMEDRGLVVSFAQAALFGMLGGTPVSATKAPARAGIQLQAPPAFRAMAAALSAG